MRSLNTFQDILEPRRKEFSNFMWVSRELKNVVPYKQSIKTGPEELKLEVLRSSKIQQVLRKLSEEQQISFKILEDKVTEILDEIGYNRKVKVLRWLGLVLSKIFTRVSNGIHVNEKSILKLKYQMGHAPVIYLPSHRSYADFILMSYICFHYDIEIPAIAAGMDFHGMFGMGSVLRDTGAFFMRRSYNDDNLYWDTFREYVYQLTVKGDLGIEFFIEGTRSRTGKSLPPKFGLLTMVLKAFFNGEVPDIHFVPINISYDRIMEERLFAFELLGVPKPKETTSGFFKSLKLINERYGDIYVNFGQPISAHTFFEDRIDRSTRNMRPKHLQVTTESERRTVSTLAEEIVNRQQKLCVITIFNVITVVFTNNLMSNAEALTIDLLIKEITWIQSVFETFGAVTNYVNVNEEIFTSLEVHQNVLHVNEKKEVCLVQNDIVLDNLDASKLKGHSLSEKTMNVAIPFVMLQLYVNPTLHYFVNPALLTVILQICTNLEMQQDKLCEEYCVLRSLFGKEFALFPNREKMEFEESVKLLQDLNVIKLDGTNIKLYENKKLQQLLRNLIAPFIVTYYVVSLVLKKLAVSDSSEKTILAASQSRIEVLLNKSTTFVHPYSLSLDSISNCLLSLEESGAVRKIKKNNSIFYRINIEATMTVEVKLYTYLKGTIPKELCDILDSGVHLPCKM